MGSGLLGYGLGESPRPLVLSVSWDEDWGEMGYYSLTLSTCKLIRWGGGLGLFWRKNV